MKRIFTAAASGLALALSAPALSQEEDVNLGEDGQVGGEEVFEFQTVEEEAAEEFEREMTEAFSIFGEMFEAEPLTEEQEARLPLANKMVDKVFPEGSFAVVMDQSMKPMMTAMMGAVTGDPRTELASLSGVPVEDLYELDDEAAQAALDILDPQYAGRNDRINQIVIDMMGDLFAAIEPSYREALARAFSIRFEGSEIEELLVFFETPVGGKFARESFLVQYDPQMMGMMEAMGPAMGEVFRKMMEQIAQMAEDFPEGRKFPELSAAERRRLSELLGKGESELEALAPEPEAEEEESEGVI
ncbi:hypothetical protein [Erythrobacter sp. THAF29]|uniref:hypothetical protein n=1 Tax=Erythrobacter sp. THAF29 TaxID=2587851 RepID=UPI001267B0BB|nr:hypothetical protein [Erythrobacter sp. THAF29]QFT76196.1 hypothetical protein FIU90_01440 [Erythrobacter sp. THAF29]